MGPKALGRKHQKHQMKTEEDKLNTKNIHGNKMPKWKRIS